MEAYLLLIIIIKFFKLNGNPNLYITFEVVEADDCISSVHFLGNNANLYSKDISDPDNNCNHDYQITNKVIVESEPYEIGKEIVVVLHDRGGGDGNKAALSINAYLNEYIIKSGNDKYWRHDGFSGNYISSKESNYNDYYDIELTGTEPKDFNFIFQIKSLSDLFYLFNSFKANSNLLYRYPYYLSNQNYFFNHIQSHEETINLIYLNSTDVIYAKNDKNKIIEPIYDYLGFQIYFDNYFSSLEILGLDNLKGDIILNTNTIYNMSKIQLLRYNLTELEKYQKGTHIQFRIKIYDFKNDSVTDFEDFNFFICLDGYTICDADTYMKCLTEGFYTSHDKYNYSCYETCKTCNTFQKPFTANYTHNYCDSCKDEYSYFVNNTDNGNNFYISCFRNCPKHALYLKEANGTECLSQCPEYKTIDKVCVDKCDYEIYKYLLKENKTCYNYIPKNYSLYIDNYSEFYDNSNIPLINIINKCPIGYDSSFKNYCINSTLDIYHLIPDPNELIEYNDPIIISLETKNITIRAYSSDSKDNDLKYYDNKLFKVDISACEKNLREHYNIPQEESIIIYDVNNIDNDNYTFKLFSSKGEVLSNNICTENNAINIKKYYTKKDLNTVKCPKEFPYYNTLNDKCIKYCDIDTYLNKNCLTNFINTENKEKNINYIKDSIKSYSISSMLDNITNFGEDIIIEEEGIKYHLTSTSNQNNKIYQNISNIYLGKCENKLKEKYNINQNQSLLIFKVDIDINGFSAPIVEYEVYHPITKEKLDLSFCDKDLIKISIPTSIDINEKEMTKYDPKSDFYNDICSTYTTKFNTDITLKDRQNEFINNNMFLCEENCDFIQYNSSSKIIDCECGIKFTMKDLSNIKINEDVLKSKFNLIKMINIKVIKCYKKLFCKEGILFNIGSYILLTIILIFIICFIIFLNKEFISFQKEIEIYIKHDINNINNVTKINNEEDKVVSYLDKKASLKRIIKKMKIKIKIKKGQKKEFDDITDLDPSSGRILPNIINNEQK